MGDGQDLRPPPPSWLNRDFVERALRAGDNNPKLTVTSCEVSWATSVGAGYGTDIYRIIASLPDSQERRVVVKCFPEGRGGAIETLIQQAGVFDIEIRMFTDTVPAMQKLLDEARPGEYQPFAAKCFYHGNKPVPFIVLEDLRHSGFIMGNRQGLDLAHTSMAIKVLARFHATSVGLHKMNPGRVECYDKAAWAEETREHLGKFFEKGIQNLEELTSKLPGYEKYSYKLKNLKPKYYDKIVDICKRRDNEYNVLRHGDLWTNNMMFKYNGDTVEDIRLLDFQIPHFASPALDLHYFLYGCPSEETRIHHLENMLKLYHNTFVDTLNILGCSDKVISFQQFKKMFDDYLFFGFVAATVMMPIFISKPEDGFEFESSQNEEGDVAYKRMYSNEEYVKAIKRMLPIFDEKGILDE